MFLIGTYCCKTTHTSGYHCAWRRWMVWELRPLLSNEFWGDVNIQFIKLMIKTLSQLRIEGNLLNLIKIILLKSPIANIIINGAIVNAFLRKQAKGKDAFTLSSLIHHGTKTLKQYKKARKRYAN